MASFEGETGPHVQYAYARIQSILRKADFKPDAAGNYSLNDAEKLKSLNYSKTFHVLSIVQQITFEPSIIAKFTISLAQAFNKYYAHTRILDESPWARQSSSPQLRKPQWSSKEALRLLGVEAPEKMWFSTNNWN